jgi:hypothetical protein
MLLDQMVRHRIAAASVDQRLLRRRLQPCCAKSRQARPQGDRTLSVSITEDSSGDTLLCNHIRATIEQPGAVNQAWMHNVTAFMAKLQKEQVRILHHGFLTNLPYMLIGALPLCAVPEVAVS